MDVSVILVNYNTKRLILDCIKSIFEMTRGLSFEVIVVDNSSSDDSIPAIREYYPNVILVESDKNLGFGKANNLGLTKASGEYILFLNSDTILLNNAIFLFYNFAKVNSSKFKIGCLGGYLLDNDFNVNGYGDTFPSVKNYLLRLFKVFLSKVGFGSTELMSPRVEHILSVDYVLGADMFLPREVLTKVGVFDPAFFMYYEESDLQKRIRSNGYECLIIPGPQIVHLEGKSTKMKYKKMEMVKRSSIIYFKKHSSKAVYLLYRLIGIIESIFVVLNWKTTLTKEEKMSYLHLNLSAFSKLNIYK